MNHTTSSSGEPIVIIDHVSKTFHIPHERRYTIRDNIAHLFRRVDYEVFKALNDVTIQVQPGEFLGVVGRNGAGKSTFLKIVAGIYPPSSGSVQVRGTISPFLELGVGFNPELSARDNVFLYGALLNISRQRLKERFDAIIQFAELEKFVDTKLKNFSSGMWVRLAFAVAIEVEADIFLIDEVLAVGDQKFQQKCFAEFEEFKRRGKTVIYVSHSLDTMKRFCTRCIYIANGAVCADGAPAMVLDKYARDMA